MDGFWPVIHANDRDIGKSNRPTRLLSAGGAIQRAEPCATIRLLVFPVA